MRELVRRNLDIHGVTKGSVSGPTLEAETGRGPQRNEITMEPSNQSEPMSERVYHSMRDAIIIGEMAPGQTFTESTLVQQFQVSTSPLREALSRLRQDGLIKVLPRKGYIVTELTLNDFHDLIQMRLILESAAAELAATRTTENDVSLLTRLSGVSIEEGDSQSHRNFMQANQNFHLHIAHISGNQRLHAALRQNFQDIQRILFANIGSGSGQTDTSDHLPIIDALARRDRNAAREASIDHIKQSRDRIIDRMLQRTNELTLQGMEL